MKIWNVKKRFGLPTDDKAQILLEYALILGILALVMFGMGPMLKRGVQSLIRLVADQVGIQENAEQKFDESDHLESRYISTRSTTDKRTQDLYGITSYVFSDTTETTSNTLFNLGFTEE